MGGAPHYIHFGFIIISVANLVVILLLIVIFAAAVALRWPGPRPDTVGPDPDTRPEQREENAG
ncbi:MAG: hypothetical protein M1582_03735 [Actinobacteria bacterium]|nr:hypothetical protein [Actinomycetota bacterium]